jgi:hypothetical protein
MIITVPTPAFLPAPDYIEVPVTGKQYRNLKRGKPFAPLMKFFERLLCVGFHESRIEGAMLLGSVSADVDGVLLEKQAFKFADIRRAARIQREEIASLSLHSAQQTPSAEAAKKPSITDKTKGMQKQDGFFPIYWDEPNGTLFLEIPKLEMEVLYQTGLSSGMGSNDIRLDRGLLADTRIVKFERIGQKILMVQPNYGDRATTDNPAEKKAVEDAFATSTIWGFTVAAESDGRVLVDATAFLLRDAVNVSEQLRPASYRFEPSRSAIYMPDTEAFPQNTELEVTTTLVSGSTAAGPGQLGGRIADVVPSPDAMTVRQHHSFIQLPDGSYHPRAFDPRAGYFDISYMDFSAPLGAGGMGEVYRARDTRSNREVAVNDDDSSR